MVNVCGSALIGSSRSGCLSTWTTRLKTTGRPSVGRARDDDLGRRPRSVLHRRQGLHGRHSLHVPALELAGQQSGSGSAATADRSESESFLARASVSSLTTGGGGDAAGRQVADERRRGPGALEGGDAEGDATGEQRQRQDEARAQDEAPDDPAPRRSLVPSIEPPRRRGTRLRSTAADGRPMAARGGDPRWPRPSRRQLVRMGASRASSTRRRRSAGPAAGASGAASLGRGSARGGEPRPAGVVVVRAGSAGVAGSSRAARRRARSARRRRRRRRARRRRRLGAGIERIVVVALIRLRSGWAAG